MLRCQSQTQTQSVQLPGNQSGSSQTHPNKAASPLSSAQTEVARGLLAVAQSSSTAIPTNPIVGFDIKSTSNSTTPGPPQERPRRPPGLLSQAFSNQPQAPTELRCGSTASHSDSDSDSDSDITSASDSDSGREPSGNNMQNQGGNSGVFKKTQPIPIIVPKPSHPNYSTYQRMQKMRDWCVQQDYLKAIHQGKATLQQLLNAIPANLNEKDIAELNKIRKYTVRPQIQEGTLPDLGKHVTYIHKATKFCNKLIAQGNIEINV